MSDAIDDACSFPGCDRLRASRFQPLCKGHWRMQTRDQQLRPLRHLINAEKCEGPSCDRKPVARGVCAAHYHQRRKGKDLLPIRDGKPKPCSFDECDKRAVTKGLCVGHDSQRRDGGPLRILRPKRPNGVNKERDRFGRKLCNRCNGWKPESEFVARRDLGEGYRSSSCKDCLTAYRRLLRYKITPEQYEVMLAKQGGRCAICRTSKPGRKSSKFFVDHDHACCPGDAIPCGSCNRGLLCLTCNSGLGSFRDNAALMRRAITYLGQHQQLKLFVA